MPNPLRSWVELMRMWMRILLAAAPPVMALMLAAGAMVAQQQD